MLDNIKQRRSVRKFKKAEIDDKTINEIIESGIWAPSGLNNQPWKFSVVRDRKVLQQLSALTRYGAVIDNAPVCIAVFLDHEKIYHREKDIQSVGACIQNMLLAIHIKGLGGVWLGEILKNREKAEQIINVDKNLELMAVIALGVPADTVHGKAERKSLESFMVSRI